MVLEMGLSQCQLAKIPQWENRVYCQLQLQACSLTSYGEHKNTMTHNCQNSVFQSFYFFVPIISDLLSHCRPLAMDESLFSSMLSVWKQNQWGKKKCIFSHSAFPFFCPFSFPSQFSTSAPACWTMINSKYISERQDEQPSPSQLQHPCSLASFHLNVWTEQAAATSRYHGAHRLALLAHIQRGRLAESYQIYLPQRNWRSLTNPLTTAQMSFFPDWIF